MKPWAFLRDFPTARQTRLGLLVGLPLALIFGQRAVAWADLQLKTWTAGQPLKAADLTAEFQKVKTEIDAGKMQVQIGDVYKGPTLLFNPNAQTLDMSAPTAFVDVKVEGTFRVSGRMYATCINTTPGAQDRYLDIKIRLVSSTSTAVELAQLPDVMHLNQQGVASPTKTLTAIMKPEAFYKLSPGVHTFGVSSSTACEQGSYLQSPAYLVIEKVQ